MTSGPTMLTPSVCPSGAALATAAVPVLPLAPARFSTTNGLAVRCCSPSATMRARLSGVEPAANGTTMVTVCAGHSWAWAALQVRDSASSAANKRHIARLAPTQRRLEPGAAIGGVEVALEARRLDSADAQQHERCAVALADQ